jgi:hypothetical protein
MQQQLPEMSYAVIQNPLRILLLYPAISIQRYELPPWNDQLNFVMNEPTAKQTALL